MVCWVPVWPQGQIHITGFILMCLFYYLIVSIVTTRKECIWQTQTPVYTNNRLSKYEVQYRKFFFGCFVQKSFISRASVQEVEKNLPCFYLLHAHKHFPSIALGATLYTLLFLFYSLLLFIYSLQVIYRSRFSYCSDEHIGGKLSSQSL